MAEDRPITTVIVEEEALVLGLLERVVVQRGRFRVVLATGHGDAFAQAAAALPAPEVAVVGTAAGAGAADGAATIAWMKAHWPRTRVLAIVGERTAACVLRLVRAGACGLVCSRTASPVLLEQALDEVHAHGLYQPPDLLPILAAGEALASEHETLIASLSRMERKVLDAVCAPDHPQWKVVAERLYVSLATISTHSAALFRKLGVTNKTALVQKGRALGFGKGTW
ncbi:MAG: response regulator transcription factor [Flavobacteriales bacterium]|nr:response regulator transcription factor [Flavobacteriales bacterium]